MKHSHDHSEHDFTGERMIPQHNKGFAFYFEHLLRYIFSTQFVKSKNVLDLGSGSGYGTRILKSMGAKKVLGIDISEEAVEYAKGKYGVSGVKYVSGDVEKLTKFSEKFDTVTAFEIMEHLANHDDFLKGVKEVLKSEGVFLVSTPNKFTYPKGNPFHINELYPDEFKKVLKKYFKNVYLFNQQTLFSHSMVPFDEKSNLNLDFIEENFIESAKVSLIPEIEVGKSMYIVAVCSDNHIKDIKAYALDSFNVDEFSLDKGVEGMSAVFKNGEGSAEIKELRRSYEEITSSKFFKLWQSFNQLKRRIKGS